MAVQNLINEYITEFIFKFRHYIPFIQLLIKVKINFYKNNIVLLDIFLISIKKFLVVSDAYNLHKMIFCNGRTIYNFVTYV